MTLVGGGGGGQGGGREAEKDNWVAGFTALSAIFQLYLAKEKG